MIQNDFYTDSCFLQSTAPPAPLSSSPPSSPLPSSPAPAASSSPNAAPAPAPTGDYITTQVYNQQGFPTTITEPAEYLTASKTYDEQGFQVLPTGAVAYNNRIYVAKGEEAGKDKRAADSRVKIHDEAVSIATSDVGSTTSSDPGSPSSSSPSTTDPGSAQTSTTMSTSTTTTYAPPSSLNPTPMPIPTAMGAASGISVRLWSVGLACGVVGFAVLMV